MKIGEMKIGEMKIGEMKNEMTAVITARSLQDIIARDVR